MIVENLQPSKYGRRLRESISLLLWGNNSIIQAIGTLREGSIANDLVSWGGLKHELIVNALRHV
jgi:hypothetical protein